MASYWQPACIEIGIGKQHQAKVVPILYALDPMHQLNFTWRQNIWRCMMSNLQTSIRQSKQEISINHFFLKYTWNSNLNELFRNYMSSGKCNQNTTRFFWLLVKISSTVRTLMALIIMHVYACYNPTHGYYSWRHYLDHLEWVIWVWFSDSNINHVKNTQIIGSLYDE